MKNLQSQDRAAHVSHPERSEGSRSCPLILLALLLVFVTIPAIASGLHKPLQWNLQNDPAGKIFTPTIAGDIDGIPSNSVIDLEISSPYIWLATGVGLGRFAPVIGASDPSDGDWFVATHEDEGFGRGGVSAVTAGLTPWGDPVIWAATAFDSLAGNDKLPTGGGVGFSLDE
ncbi:MAG TPA: hypothetical protein ENH10_05445, partial [Bacteroidetes bacterium]|nr:hypothetical protein [Bacteroidota bacterium]HEX04588.1 hypothetical protein [Bacteroidota bacterium]